MKNILFVILLFMTPFMDKSEDFDLEIQYGTVLKFRTMTETKVSVIGYSQLTENIVIPSEIEYNGISYTVTDIDDNAFKTCTTLNSVEIPNTITSIGQYAFSECSSLTSVIFETDSQLNIIGVRAFEDCSSLTSIEIPDSVKSIGMYAFYNCSSLANIDFGNNPQITGLGNSVFRNCSSISSIEIPNTVTIIDFQAFNGCSNLVDITFAENSQLATIGFEAFRGCSSLTDIELPNSLSSIGQSSFRGCIGLTSIEIPCNVTTIDERAFIYCSNLSSINFENNSKLTTIGKEIILGCSNVAIDFGDNSSLSSFESDIFKSCTSLYSISFGDNSKLKYIRTGAFEGCTNLTEVDFGNNSQLIYIYDRSFKDCSNLANLDLGNNSKLVYLGEDVFRGCSNLLYFEIPNTLTTINKNAFYGCSLISINFANNPILTNIGEYAFSHSGIEYFQIPNSVTTIKNNAFDACIKLKNIIIPNSVTTIGAYAFYNCTSLMSIEIPNAITTISDYTFNKCSGLTYVTFNENTQITTIGNSAFQSCSSLTSIEIPATVASIGDYAFRGCTSLTNFNYEENSQLTSIGDNAFNACTGLTKIEIPINVTSIGNYAFYCVNLKEVFVRIQEPISISYNTFSGSLSNAILYVPYTKSEQYSNNDNWSRCFSEVRDSYPQTDDTFIIGIPSSNETINVNVKVINDQPLELELKSLCSAIEDESFVLPSTVKGYDGTSFIISAIAESFFDGCDNLVSLSIPRTVNRIEDAFDGCINIETIIVDYRYPADVEVTSETFSGLSDNVTLIVPAGTSERYAELDEWSKFCQIVENTPVSLDDIHANSGGEVFLPISLKTNDIIAGMQYRLTLPEGITPVSDNDKYLIEFTDRTETMTVVGNKDPDMENSYLFAMLSLEGDNIEGEEGVILKLKLSVDEDVELGDYDIIMNEVYAITSSIETKEYAETYSILTIDDIHIHEANLNNGWNWYSTYINNVGSQGLSILEQGLGTNGLEIKDQALFVTYTAGAGWFGSMTQTAVEEMYMIKMSEAAVLNISGSIVNTSEHPITLTTNWRWFSYPLNESMSIASALSNFAPHDGDYIKSQAGFSQYYEGIGWLGAVNTMTPGEGYMYKNTSGIAKVLIYPSSSGSKVGLKQNVTPEDNYWQPDMTKYADNMNIIAVVDSDSDYEIGAFCEGECRGSARPIYIEELDKKMIFLTVYGESQDEIMFRYYDVEKAEEYAFPAEEIVVFGVNSTLGSIKEPYDLHFGMLGVEDKNTEVFTVYPNPATISEEIYLGGSFEMVEVYNALGVKVAIYEDVDKIESLKTAGVYVIKIINDNESRYCRVIIK